jgi:hypothetical protein
VLPARRAWFAEGLARKKINLDHARMELRDLREIHAERPHRFQRRVDDDFLLGSERWLHSFLQCQFFCAFIDTKTQAQNSLSYLSDRF